MKDIKKIQIKSLDIISQYLRLKIHWMVCITSRLYTAEEKISKLASNTGNYTKWNTKRKRL